MDLADITNDTNNETIRPLIQGTDEGLKDAPSPKRARRSQRGHFVTGSGVPDATIRWLNALSRPPPFMISAVPAPAHGHIGKSEALNKDGEHSRESLSLDA